MSDKADKERIVQSYIVHIDVKLCIGCNLVHVLYSYTFCLTHNGPVEQSVSVCVYVCVCGVWTITFQQNDF